MMAQKHEADASAGGKRQTSPKPKAGLGQDQTPSSTCIAQAFRRHAKGDDLEKYQQITGNKAKAAFRTQFYNTHVANIKGSLKSSTTESKDDVVEGIADKIV